MQKKRFKQNFYIFRMCLFLTVGSVFDLFIRLYNHHVIRITLCRYYVNYNHFYLLQYSRHKQLELQFRRGWSTIALLSNLKYMFKSEAFL